MRFQLHLKFNTTLNLFAAVAVRAVPKEEGAGVQVQQVPEERRGRQVVGSVAFFRRGGLVASSRHYTPIGHDEAIPLRP